MAISPQRLTIYLYSAYRAVIFAIAQLSCTSLLIRRSLGLQVFFHEVMLSAIVSCYHRYSLRAYHNEWSIANHRLLILCRRLCHQKPCLYGDCLPMEKWVFYATLLSNKVARQSRSTLLRVWLWHGPKIRQCDPRPNEVKSAKYGFCFWLLPSHQHSFCFPLYPCKTSMFIDRSILISILIFAGWGRLELTHVVTHYGHSSLQTYS